MSQATQRFRQGSTIGFYPEDPWSTANPTVGGPTAPYDPAQWRNRLTARGQMVVLEDRPLVGAPNYGRPHGSVTRRRWDQPTTNVQVNIDLEMSIHGLGLLFQEVLGVPTAGPATPGGLNTHIWALGVDQGCRGMAVRQIVRQRDGVTCEQQIITGWKPSVLEFKFAANGVVMVHMEGLGQQVLTVAGAAWTTVNFVNDPVTLGTERILMVGTDPMTGAWTVAATPYPLLMETDLSIKVDRKLVRVAGFQSAATQMPEPSEETEVTVETTVPWDRNDFIKFHRDGAEGPMQFVQTHRKGDAAGGGKMTLDLAMAHLEPVSIPSADSRLMQRLKWQVGSDDQNPTGHGLKLTLTNEFADPLGA